LGIASWQLPSCASLIPSVARSRAAALFSADASSAPAGAVRSERTNAALQARVGAGELRPIAGAIPGERAGNIIRILGREQRASAWVWALVRPSAVAESRRLGVWESTWGGPLALVQERP